MLALSTDQQLRNLHFFDTIKVELIIPDVTREKILSYF